MKNYKELILLVVFIVITYCYYPSNENEKAVEPENKITSISNDYAQAYDYCIKIRTNGNK